jgi:5-methylthioribose kinase
MLQQADRFQQDVKKYTEVIDQMDDGQTKLEAKRLLNDLIYEVKNMDNMYIDMVYANQLPTIGTEMREKIVGLRKQLNKKLKL